MSSSKLESIYNYIKPDLNDLTATKTLFILLGALGLLARARLIFTSVLVLLQTFLLPGKSVKKYGANKGAWALITGASDGIGKEFAYQLAKAGYNILLVSRTQEKLQNVASEISSKYPDSTTEIFTIDFTSATEEKYTALEKTCAEKEIGILVNNVGQSYDMPTSFAEVSLEIQEAVINVNVKGTLRVTKIVLPSMIKRRRGLILTLTSFSGEIASPLLAVYSGSKAFLQTWSDALQCELREHGVDVQTVNTYFVATNMSKIRRTSMLIPSPKSFVQSVLGKIGQPCGAFGTGRPSASTPYWSHSIVDYLIHIIGKTFFISYTLGMHKDIRRRALRKLERERANAKKE